MSEELKFPTLAIQLKNETGIPYDMPEDWLETVLTISNLIYQKYQVGIDVVYGSASREGFIILEKECHKNS